MTTFDKREEGFEKKFALDEELLFKAGARRNKLLGLWAAEKLGISGAEADAYAKTVVMADFARQIQDEIDNENAVRLVLSVSIKDHGSLFHQLGADLLRLIIDAARQPEIVLWEDVLRGFVRHDLGAEV